MVKDKYPTIHRTRTQNFKDLAFFIWVYGRWIIALAILYPLIDAITFR